MQKQKNTKESREGVCLSICPDEGKNRKGKGWIVERAEGGIVFFLSTSSYRKENVSDIDRRKMRKKKYGSVIH